MNTWLQLLAVLGGNAFLLAAVAWLSQQLVGHQLNKALATYEDHLSREAARTAAELQHALDRVLSVDSLRFQYLQERRTQLVCELWDHVIRTRTGLRELTARIRWEPVNHDERLNATWESYKLLHNKNLICELLFPPELCERVEAYRSLAMTLISQAANAIAEAKAQGTDPDQSPVLGAVYLAVHDHLEPLEAPLLVALRIQLGQVPEGNNAPHAGDRGAPPRPAGGA